MLLTVARLGLLTAEYLADFEVFVMKKIIRKIISALLTLALVSVAFSSFAFAEEGKSYTLSVPASNGKVEVKVNVAALAVNMAAGATVTDVSVSGTIATNYNGEFPCLNEVYYHKDAADAAIMAGVTDFTANIIVNKQ